MTPNWTVRVATLPMEHIFELNGSRYSGVDANLLQLLSERMGFGYELVIPADGQWGSPKPNGGWSGIIGLLSEGRADLGLNHLAVTEARTTAVHFSAPYAALDRTFVSGRPDVLPQATVYARPFDATVWALSVVILLVAPVLFGMADGVKRRREGFWGTLLVLLGSICRQPLGYRCNSFVFRIFFASWWFYADFLSRAYSAVLLSFLTVPSRGPGLKTIDSMWEAVREGRVRLLAAEGSVDLELMLASSLDSARLLGTVIRDNGWTYDTRGNIRDQLSPGTALIGSRARLEIAFRREEATVSRSSFGVSSVAVAVHPGFCCKTQLDELVGRILSAGLYQKWSEMERFFTESRARGGEKRPADAVLTLDETRGVFLMLLIGYAVAAVCLVGELCCFKYKKQKRS